MDGLLLVAFPSLFDPAHGGQICCKEIHREAHMHYIIIYNMCIIYTQSINRIFRISIDGRPGDFRVSSAGLFIENVLCGAAVIKKGKHTFNCIGIQWAIFKGVYFTHSLRSDHSKHRKSIHVITSTI